MISAYQTESVDRNYQPEDIEGQREAHQYWVGSIVPPEHIN